MKRLNKALGIWFILFLNYQNLILNLKDKEGYEKKVSMNSHKSICYLLAFFIWSILNEN